ncbi:MAG: cupin domain-containing protein [Planctomycetes bacterium]|nr:cupin domain-containing protein [Planctomycetota bacterium]
MANERYVVRRPTDVREERSTCGFRRRLLKADEFPDLSISLLNLHNAKLHHHNRTTEFYYVIEGKGQLELDGERVDVEPGVLARINPPTRHRALGDFTALILCSPAWTTEDNIVDE